LKRKYETEDRLSHVSSSRSQHQDDDVRSVKSAKSSTSSKRSQQISSFSKTSANVFNIEISNLNPESLSSKDIFRTLSKGEVLSYNQGENGKYAVALKESEPKA
jgi:hypothetical protein